MPNTRGSQVKLNHLSAKSFSLWPMGIVSMTFLILAGVRSMVFISQDDDLQKISFGCSWELENKTRFLRRTTWVRDPSDGLEFFHIMAVFASHLFVIWKGCTLWMDFKVFKGFSFFVYWSIFTTSFLLMWWSWKAVFVLSDCLPISIEKNGSYNLKTELLQIFLFKRQLQY